jgi:hypothetical protein
MPPLDNVVKLETFKQASSQELIDDIGARAFMFLRDEAECNNVPVKEVIIEHLLGIALVIEAVDGAEEAQSVLSAISQQLSNSN